MESKILELSKKLMSVPSVKGEVKELNRVLEIAKKELNGYSYKEYKSNGEVITSSP